MEREKEIIQNLKDAGCNDVIVNAFISTIKKGEASEGLGILTQHRQGLLRSVHESEKQIDCLDYLIYQIKNRPKER